MDSIGYLPLALLFFFMIIDAIAQMDDFGPSPYAYKEGNIESISDPNKLYDAYKLSKKNVSWKPSVQRYGLNLLSNIVSAHDQLESGNYKMTDPYEFTINERGHTRYVKAIYIFDRVIQRSFNDNVLNPIINKVAIYDNSASQIGKGVSFARERFKVHLRNAYNKWGKNSYVLFIDFSKFFDNILHSEALAQFKPYMTEEEYKFLEITFHTFDIDVSYMSDEEFLRYRDELFNMLEYSANIPKEILTGEKMMPKSVGIGNQTSQGTGVMYPHEIDNYVTCVRGYGEYGRYMDDIHIFAQTKEELIELLRCIAEICDRLGIHINAKKTRIQPIYTVMTYLKINYKITDTGRILEIVPGKIFKRERDRITKFHEMVLKGKMPLEDVVLCYLSWYGTYIQFDSKRKMMIIDHYFKDIFCLGIYDTDLNAWIKMMFKSKKRDRVQSVRYNYI